MKDNPAERDSVWAATTEVLRPPALAADARADVCVVGAGIAGLSAAYLLAAEGRSVVVLDKGPVGGGQTERTTAHLSNAIDDRYAEIERLHGEKGARLAAESHTAAINLIEATVASEEIDCEFERLDGYLVLPEGEDPDVLSREAKAARRAGLDVELVSRPPLRSIGPGACLRFPGQGMFHPLKYLAGLARAVGRGDGRVCTGSRVEKVEGGSPARVVTAGGPTVTADAVVVATNTPINDLVAIHTKQAPYISYAVAARVPRGSVPRALYWDTLDPYHYVRLQAGPKGGADELLIVGGEDHKTGQAGDHAERYARLEEWGRRHFPLMGAVEYRWSGQVMETVDGLAFIGRNPMDAPNVYVATGDSGMGMTHGTIAGILLTDLICGRQNPWADLYEPSRKTLRSVKELRRKT
jgi:glycine/D-amino acid oxidase-like deaminating enzyme